MFIEHFHHIFFICPIALSFVDITLLFFTYVHSVGFLWTLHFCFLYMSIHFIFRTLCFCFWFIYGSLLGNEVPNFSNGTQTSPRMPVDTRGLATYLTIRFYFFITLPSFLSENGINPWVAGLFRSIIFSKLCTLRWAIRSYCWQIVPIFGL